MVCNPTREYSAPNSPVNWKAVPRKIPFYHPLFAVKTYLLLKKKKQGLWGNIRYVPRPLSSWKSLTDSSWKAARVLELVTDSVGVYPVGPEHTVLSVVLREDCPIMEQEPGDICRDDYLHSALSAEAEQLLSELTY